ncbi:MAG: AAA family ATPase [Gammaproteobacteria bacterium]|nr:AAA family ATPase [Gammaproteobacteria bacterium]
MPDIRTIEEHTRLIHALRNPKVYPHPVSEIVVVETHISTVLLTGHFAYKIKKPINFGYIDFSTATRRQQFCEEELRLNRRLAPNLYLDIIGIGGSLTHPVLGTSEPWEFMVKMRQFDQKGLLSNLARDKRLEARHIDAITEQMARFHSRAKAAGPDEKWGEPETLFQPVLANFAQIRPRLGNAEDISRMTRLAAWSDAEWQRLKTRFIARKKEGKVRECHGDLHLGNIALIEDKVTIFDGIEFEPALVWIDVMSEVAFFVMDLRERGFHFLAQRFLNGYLRQSGDYGGVGVLRFYLVYRALVRAKVTLIRSEQLESAVGREAALKEYQNYILLAAYFTRPKPRVLIITHGLSGSGKSHFAQALAERLGLIQVSSDIERKRLFNIATHDRSGAERGMYSPEAHQHTYDRLAAIATELIRYGEQPIIDATFLDAASRARFQALAEELDARFLILACEAPPELLRERVRARQTANNDASDAGIDVLEKQLANRASLSAEELARTVRINAAAPLNQATIDLLRHRLDGK